MLLRSNYTITLAITNIAHVILQNRCTHAYNIKKYILYLRNKMIIVKLIIDIWAVICKQSSLFHSKNWSKLF